MQPFQKIALSLCFFLMVGLIAVVVGKGPIPQDLTYHQFYDTYPFLNIPNGLNVISNAPFLLLGLLGLFGVQKKLAIIPDIKSAYIIFFSGVAAVAFGSAYYHFSPNNQTLLWDRLPIAIAFMALTSIIIAEYISVRWAKRLLLPLVLCGLASVLYWHFSEQSNKGDLRFYILVQFLPMLFIPAILLCCRPVWSHTIAYWQLLVAYVLAKISEFWDGQIYGLLAGIISGHSLKHIFAAIGIYILYAAYKKRVPIRHQC